MEDGEIVEGAPMEEEESATPSALGGSEAQEHKPEKSPHEQLKGTTSAVEEAVAEILAVKRANKPKSQLRELITQMFVHFVTIRQVNRTILVEEDRVKTETEKAKAPVDFTTLQLHNLMYEKSHYVKAIKACKDFKSKYPDIELVPEEEFFRDAPDHIKGPVLSDDSSHNLMLKRLNFELHQRKELCKLREKLEERKKGLLETIANRKKFLSSLPSHLKSLKKASLPVQNQLGVQHTKKLKQHNSAELLPPPLYVIYSQFMAQKEAFGEEIDVEIVGSLKDAQAFARQQANKDTSISNNAETLGAEDDVPDEEDDGQRRRKRPKRVPSKETLDQTGANQVHPLKIVLHIYDDEVSDPKSAKLITLKFEYLLKLNVVCVGIEESEEGPINNILCNLFPNDTGLELPHQSAKLVVGNTQLFDERRTSRPYKWAQHLAGIDFLPEVAPLLSDRENSGSESTKSDAVVSGLSLYRQQNRVQTVVQRIRSRKKAQLALVEQLDSLMKLNWPSLNCQSVPWALHTPLCDLHGWSPIDSPPYLESSLPVNDTDQVPEPRNVDMDRRSGTSKGEPEGAREDGELPSLVSVSSVVNDIKLSSVKLPDLEHSKQLALISKSTVSPITKAKSLSFKKHDEDSDLVLYSDSDHDERVQMDVEVENVVSTQGCGMGNMLWVDYGVKEYSLVLTRKKKADGRSVKLEAKIKISMEYPLRPPLFSVNLYTDEEIDEGDSVEWCNELRAMEAEVNLHIVKTLPLDQENYILAHQVRCLAMLFDYFLDEASPGRKSCTNVIDVGLCKPVNGRLLARAFRGRDRRKMISWKDVECTSDRPD